MRNCLEIILFVFSRCLTVKFCSEREGEANVFDFPLNCNCQKHPRYTSHQSQKVTLNTVQLHKTEHTFNSEFNVNIVCYIIFHNIKCHLNFNGLSRGFLIFCLKMKLDMKSRLCRLFFRILLKLLTVGHFI